MHYQHLFAAANCFLGVRRTRLPLYSPGKRATLLIPALILASAVTGSQLNHWTETSNELIWRELYTNCDHGYFVNLPPGVVGHGPRPPSPNHGILISPKEPSVTTEVTLGEPRLIDVYDTLDVLELKTPRAYVDRYELKPKASEKITVLEERDTKFRGSPAVYVHLRKSGKLLASEIEELAVYRKPKGIGPIFNVVLLQTAPEYYSQDHALYLQIRDGLQFIPAATSECPND
jgi:hypothetical protein